MAITDGYVYKDGAYFKFGGAAPDGSGPYAIDSAGVATLLGGGGVTPGATGAVRIYRPTSYTTLPSGSVNLVTARIAVPAGAWNANCFGIHAFECGKIGAGTDTINVFSYVGTPGFVGVGATNRVMNAATINTAANSRFMGAATIWGNKVDTTTAFTTVRTGDPAPYTSTATTLRTTLTLDFSAAFDVTVQLQTAATDSAACSDAYFLIYDVGASASTSLIMKDEGVTLTSTPSTINFTGGGVTASNVGGVVTVAIAGGGSTNWQTYTPNVSPAVAIAMDYVSGPNVHLLAPVNDAQPVNLPLNLPDGGEMEIHLVGGGGSGSWLPIWDVGAAATPGWKFLVSGVAPTAPVAGLLVPCYLKRKGAEYRVIVGTSEVTA